MDYTVAVIERRVFANQKHRINHKQSDRFVTRAKFIDALSEQLVEPSGHLRECSAHVRAIEFNAHRSLTEVHKWHTDAPAGKRFSASRQLAIGLCASFAAGRREVNQGSNRFSKR